VFLLVLLLLNFPLLLGTVPTSLVFTPASLRGGEWWRLFTHPFVHVSWYHLLLDAGAFIALYESLRDTSTWRRLGYVVAAALGSLGISWLVTPTFAQTGLCGLSGVAHGLMAVTGLELMASQTISPAERRVGLLAFLFLVAKAAWEVVTGTAFLSFLHFGLMGLPVAVSHAGGILGAVGLFAVTRRTPSSSPIHLR
jgi:rhomboid family GlyGly-CTERM serine protease